MMSPRARSKVRGICLLTFALASEVPRSPESSQAPAVTPCELPSRQLPGQ